MKHADFVHLHNHTEYSLLDGAVRLSDDKGKPSSFIRAMAETGYPALAITDHGNMHGAIEFYRMCLEAGIKPIVGMEAYVAPGSRLDREGGAGESSYHLTLLSRDIEGFRNLMKLSSCGFLEGYYYKPRIDKELLRKHNKGLIALSGCLKGEIASALLDGNDTAAEKTLAGYLDIFGKDNFYIEIMNHDLPDQIKCIPLLAQLSKRTGIPLVATNDCHYYLKEDNVAQDVLICIGHGKTINDPKRLKFGTAEFYYKSPQEMREKFKEFPSALSATMDIANRTRLELSFDQLLLPKYDVPGNTSPDDYLKQLCFDGLARRCGEIPEEYKNRLEMELGVIRKMGFSTYFLIVWDFICYARKTGIPVGPGRGSGAGSLVAYSLNITNVDPIKYGLLFERFLNPDRKSMPDLDIDFSDDGRESVINYVRNKYGSNSVAQIITFGSMLARLVVRDVGRVLEMPLAEVDGIARLIPKELGTTINSALKTSTELARMYETNPKIKQLLDIARKLEGIKRHSGVHAAGTVITSGDMTDYVPLSKGSRDVITTQYNDESLLKLGLLKIDFLGLRTLSVIRDTCNLIKDLNASDFDVETVTLNDAKTYTLLGEAKTLGIFQLESSGMRDLLLKIKPSNISDIAALISLYRPGPMGSGMLDEFVARKHAKAKVTYDHKLLEPVLADTYGVIVFQEQVMQISRVLAGFTPGQADVLRRAMGKKIPEELERQRGAFVEGAVNKGIERSKADKIFDKLVHFGGYGFNRSHAVAYGLMSYWTAYLKANYPVEFMASLITSEIGRTSLGSTETESKLITYVNEAETIGIPVLPPDINLSQPVFSIENSGNGKKCLRFGLLAVKNVGENAAKNIISAHSPCVPFSSLEELVSKIDTRQVNRKVMESLIKAGALDAFDKRQPNKTRPFLISKLSGLLARNSSARNLNNQAQAVLFDIDTIPANSAHPNLTSAENNGPEEWPEHTLLNYEKEVLGFYFSGHPLAKFQDIITACATHTITQLPESGTVKVAGMVGNVKRITTKNNEPMARFSLEDLESEINCIAFPRTYTGVAGQVIPNNMVIVKGRVEIRLEAKEIFVEDVTPLTNATEKYLRTVQLTLSTPGLEETTLQDLKKIFSNHRGNCTVELKVKTPLHGEVLIETEERISPSGTFLQEIEQLLGKDHLNFS